MSQWEYASSNQYRSPNVLFWMGMWISEVHAWHIMNQNHREEQAFHSCRERLNVDRCHPHLSSHDPIAATARYFGVRRNVKRLPNSTRMLAYISSSNKGKQVNYRGIYCIHWNLKHSKFFPPHAHTTVTTSACNGNKDWVFFKKKKERERLG